MVLEFRQHNLYNKRYKLSDQVLSLIDESTVDTSLIKDEEGKITYNRADEASLLSREQVLELAGNKEDATGKKPYQAELSKDPTKGITFSDSEGDRTINLKFLFKTTEPKLEDGRVIYPKGGNEKHIYSFKKNGIKSDIILTEAPKENTKTFEWELTLGTDLEAKLMPNGGIGIYSPDPLLYGDLQVSDEKSQQLVDNAKKNGTKTNLVFELPAPFIIDANNNKTYDNVAYKLDRTKNLLTLEATNLNNQQYPITIDPTITVTTTSDFQKKTGDTGNVDSSTADEIRRSNISSGAVGNTWGTITALTTDRYGHTSVAYNGYLYVIGGYGGIDLNDVQYAPIGQAGLERLW